MSPDLVLVGAGLANGLIAFRLAQRRPDLRILLVEQADRPGGNHTWSFHDTDLTGAARAWLKPFVTQSWPAYDVVFPHRRRTIDIGYASITSERFAEVLAAALGPGLRCGAPVREVGPTHVILEDGSDIRGGAVIDGRGLAETDALDLAYQKFLGLEIRLQAPHGLVRPVLMDATVTQQDGYRFVYLLPFGPDRLLVEDTYYADRPDLPLDALRARVRSYIAARGWQVAEVLREEAGILPITLGGDFAAFWRAGTAGLPRAGLRAGLFHPTTGYSLPDAVRLADHIAGQADLSAATLHDAIHEWSLRHWRRQGFFRLLNRMLFRAGAPESRYRVLQRFYGLPEATIGRFYAGRLSTADKLRLLVGKPPVPIAGALRALAPANPIQGAS